MSIFRHSLAVRLSLLFIGIACAVFLAIGLLAYNGMDQVLKRQQDEALRARVERLELLIQNSSDLNSLIQRPKLYENMLGNQDNLLILENQNGTALIYINPLQIHIPILPKAEQTWLIDNKKQQATTRLAWKTINYQGQQYLLIAGKQFDEREQVLYSFALKLAGYIGLGILTVCILSALVSYYGLAPLRDLSEQTRLINIQKLNQRVSETSQSDEIRLLSTAMNSMLERIEQGYQQLSRFSEDMAHEFRTPLNNLIGQTQILLSQDREKADYQDLLFSHLEEYERLKRMVENMLFLARADHSQNSLSIIEINLKSSLNELLAYFELIAEEKNLQINSRLKITFIHADYLLFQRAVSNLLNNAIEYSTENGHISIIAERITLAGKIYNAIHVLTHDVYIAEQHLPHLFERFYQCDPARHQQGRSGGLGLAIVQSIMSVHEGITEVKNMPEGVRFSLYFPEHLAGNSVNRK